MIEFYLGGSRSGKSKLAEQAALASALDVTYIATCQRLASQDDRQMLQRIEQHQQRRPQHWKLVEEAVDLAKVIARESAENRCILVDCLTLWLSNCLFHCAGEKGAQITQEVAEDIDLDFYYRQKKALLATLASSAGRVIFVSNETNMGVVPMGNLSRVFCDEAGLLHQDIARVSNKVTLAVAGLAHVLKDERS